MARGRIGAVRAERVQLCVCGGAAGHGECARERTLRAPLESACMVPRKKGGKEGAGTQR